MSMATREIETPVTKKKTNLKMVYVRKHENYIEN